MKVSIIGSGSWGTGIAQVLADNGIDVTIWGIEESQIIDINEHHQNSFFFKGVTLNPNIKASTDIEIVKGSDIVVLSVPTIAIEDVCKRITPYLKKKTIIVNTSKGFHPKTNKRMSEVIRETIPESKLSSVVSLIGPSHAEEVVQRILTTVSAVSLNEEDAKIVQREFSNEYFRIYTGSDEIGSEVGVALKNAIAVASGVLSGIGYGDNTRAALITRGLNEMIRFGMFMGGKRETFMGLTGIGDLIVTCTSPHSRNFQAGYEVGKENSADIFWDKNKNTVEGVRTAKVVHEIATKNNIDMPIINETYKILYEGKEPKTSAKDLMLRELKAE
ncbi:glycerol-3-phosphate dehydrogenase (NAD(P)+) [Breznakia sp. PF5-3]|uniref:NAD(P)H-dependent glycerol-3-phosphate dehydrogenase n=1 Tax=unclassified Breznakia TaxID=2623764 RepID=UPI0024063BB9|nr:MULTISPECIES: NAD(P)H-dependent glycerol-3-phosphate dehydrogenase [unclassified Breznakia]MDF9823920.1 glycerol-3-phosphate dehydrogenase (NAD(P)+) [Breznakia sp. PM6-1]MDF9834719.1 glycerol-3-phosphate dehydrogenase (NAD(P)+) [Breznakia sp. PF5-3]MDF9836846.1 glycerol-3-phosphate dehydrogenase (NAD(P)+) [Breznakia sp. PFB2-8]MDF9858863.1 glycerol-3-phosphate dehydrogenase (NAD(P)+) [Breznakia sp. PH5-24]